MAEPGPGRAPWQVLARRTLGRRWSASDDVRRLIVANEIPDGLSLTALSRALLAGVLP